MTTPQDLDTQCAAAMARITASVNRSAGQHLRAMRTAWALSRLGQGFKELITPAMADCFTTAMHSAQHPGTTAAPTGEPK